jgi:phage gp46-like protein
MPLDPDGGRDLALMRNPTTGRFDISWDDSGNPAHDDSDSHAVLSVLLEDKEGYWADASGERGSLLSTLKDDKQGTAQLIVSYCRQALQYLVDRGTIREIVDVIAARAASGRYDASIKYRNRGGHEKNILVPFGD